MGDGQGILSFPFKGYTLAIDFPVTNQLIAFTPKLDAKVLAAGGRLYLGKDALLNEPMFKKCTRNTGNGFLSNKNMIPGENSVQTFQEGWGLLRN